MDDLDWEYAKWRVAWDEPMRYFLEEVAPDALRMLDSDALDANTILEFLAQAFGDLSPMRIKAEVGTVIAARWLELLEAGDWGAHEAFKRRWDMWEYLADERGVAFPPPLSTWSFGDDGRPIVRPSDATVKRRLEALGVSPGPSA